MPASARRLPHPRCQDQPLAELGPPREKGCTSPYEPGVPSDPKRGPFPVLTVPPSPCPGRKKAQPAELGGFGGITANAPRSLCADAGSATARLRMLQPGTSSKSKAPAPLGAGSV